VGMDIHLFVVSAFKCVGHDVGINLWDIVEWLGNGMPD
jgi:hypothetical protein